MASNVNVPVQNPPAPPAATQPPVATAAPTNLNEMTPQQIRDLAAGAAPQPVAAPVVQPQPQAGPQPVRGADGQWAIQLPTGQVYKGASPEAAWQQLYDGQVAASRRITELNTEAERLRSGLAAVTGRPVEVTPGAAGQPAKLTWDTAVYRELEKNDPLLAQNYMDACRFGLADINDVPQAFTRMYENTTYNETARETNSFKAMAPDFPGTKEAIDKVLGFLNDNKIAYTATNLKMVHDGMVRAHSLDPTKGYAPHTPGQPQGGQPAPAAAPPAAPTPVPPPVIDANPQGLYSFGPGGFGTAPPAEAPAVAPAPQAPQPVAPAPVAATTGYPSMPVPAQQPLPPAPQGAGPTAGAGPVTEDTLNTLPTDQLKAYIMQSLQR